MSLSEYQFEIYVLDGKILISQRLIHYIQAETDNL